MKKIIVANWKMNPETSKEAKSLFSKTQMTAMKLRGVTTVVCPPFVFIDTLSKLASTTKGMECSLGAQDIFWESKGSFTGEISPAQLRDLGVRYVILGHSERRTLGETDEIVNKKIKASLNADLLPIVCIGETKRDREGEYLQFLKDQIHRTFKSIKRTQIPNIIIAYEPIWAVGKGATKADTPEELFEMVIFIKKSLRDIFPQNIVSSIPILYGGSVNEENAESFSKNGGIEGLLVGRASLSPESFTEILKSAEKTKRIV